jgi:hypothetical protein
VYDAFGVFTRFGYKFIRSPEYYKNKGKQAHLLGGAYLRPEITIGHFNETQYSHSSTSLYASSTYYTPYFRSTDAPTTHTFFALMFNAGKQWIVRDDFCIDVFGGIGLGGNSGGSRNYNYAVGGYSPLFFDIGVKIGGMFK